MGGAEKDAAIRDNGMSILYGIAGIACLWAWMHTNAFAAESPTAANCPVPVWQVHNLTLPIVFAVIYAFSKRMGWIVEGKGGVWAPILTVCGTLASGLGSGMHISLLYFGGIASAIGDCLFIVQWINLVAKYKEAKTRKIVVLCGMVISFLLYLLIAQLPHLGGTVLRAVLIGASYVCLVTAMGPIDRSVPLVGSLVEANSKKGYPLRYGIAFFVFCFAIYYIRGGGAESESLITSETWTLIFAAATVMYAFIVLLDMYVGRRLHIPVTVWCMIILTISALYFYATGLYETTFVYVLISVGYFFYLPTYYQLLSEYISTNDTDAIKAIATALLANTLGNVCGSVLGGISAGLSGTWFATSTLAVIFAAFITGHLLITDDSNSSVSCWLVAEGNVRHPDDTRRRPVESVFAENLEELLSARCRDVGFEYGLTKREQDVLHLLAYGKNLQTIANDMGLSLNTIKTHVLRIYQKCEVHSREELFGLLRR